MTVMFSAFILCIYMYNLNVLPTYLLVEVIESDEVIDFYTFGTAIDSQ